jgi:UDP-perosamine 4-acetyltransferase
VSNIITEIKVPQFGVNETTATVADWKVENNSQVNAGDIIVELETTKSVFEIESTKSGYFQALVEENCEVEVNQVIAIIGFDLETLINYKEKQYAKTENTSLSQTDATKKAVDLAKKHNIDLNDLAIYDRIINTKDVLAYTNKQKQEDQISCVESFTCEEAPHPLVIYGAGAGGLIVKETIELDGKFQVVCFLDDNRALKQVGNLPVFHSSFITELFKKNIKHCFCAVGNGAVRLKITQLILGAGLELINVVHPHSYISTSANIGVGNHIKSGAVIETNCEIGNNCIIDNGVIIAHDNKIKNGCHLAPGVSLGSNIEVGKCAVLGIGVSVSTNIIIGDYCIISVGSSVTSNFENYSLVEGVPGKLIGRRNIVK